jgi:hypothetical protein
VLNDPGFHGAASASYHGSVNPIFQTALGVSLRGLPLVGVIGWAAFQQSQRLARIEKHLDDLGTDLKALGLRVNTHDTKLAVIEAHLNACPNTLYV